MRAQQYARPASANGKHLLPAPLHVCPERAAADGTTAEGDESADSAIVAVLKAAATVLAPVRPEVAWHLDAHWLYLSRCQTQARQKSRRAHLLSLLGTRPLALRHTA